ncbi:hypothetical protein [Solirubrum puertoriconensis]|uniref:Uncharacterized protein n=1 Tax=Solirubrum puertoriconensis TaxID=1751427 RepID=A0A9X0HMI3_SOLP1|nr:hypothetical protein [Solirubrum puertoriconensis]KUG08621.1 hypothetical protein ASU33_10760 [Solirubrum puertoriconensis]
MNEAHLHLLLNHVPILGSLAGFVILLVGVLRHNASVTKTGLIMLLVAAAFALPTQLTGEGAEELIEHRPTVSHAQIEAHEDAAELAFWMLELTAIPALVALMLWQHARARLLVLLTLGGAALSFALMAYAGWEGGKINHPELTEPQTAAEAPQPMP